MILSDHNNIIIYDQIWQFMIDQYWIIYDVSFAVMIRNDHNCNIRYYRLWSDLQRYDHITTIRQSEMIRYCNLFAGKTVTLPYPSHPLPPNTSCRHSSAWSPPQTSWSTSGAQHPLVQGMLSPWFFPAQKLSEILDAKICKKIRKESTSAFVALSAHGLTATKASKYVSILGVQRAWVPILILDHRSSSAPSIFVCPKKLVR